MKKSKFSLSFALGCMLLSSLAVLPNRADAGTFTNQGSSVDSSSPSGGIFGNPNNTRNNRSIGRSGLIDQLIAPQEVQEHLNKITQKLISDASLPNTPNGILATLLLRGQNGCAAGVQLQTALESLGASSASVKALINALSTLYISPSSTTPCFSAGHFSPMQSVASHKELKNSNVIAQNNETRYVSIAQLDAAINAYNKIVQESSPETLQKLAKDPQFLQTGRFLKDLRAAIKAWDESRR